METLITIGEKDNSIDYVENRAVRAVVFDDIGRVALLNVKEKNYYLLPGGGIEEGETPKQALKRETKEETGAIVTILDTIGETVEYRNFLDPKEIKHNVCFFCAESGNRQKPKFTKKETEMCCELVWVEMNRAIELVEKSEPITKKGESAVKRDLFILKKVKSIVEG
jgi:ADP-ribose pyrophosphatase YjhB (NUDIX family)